MLPLVCELTCLLQCIMGKLKPLGGVEAAKKLKMDQILLPCQEDFFKFMWSNNIFF